MARPLNPARQAAKQAGARHYQGPPCAKGHDGVRYTSTGACVACYGVTVPAVATVAGDTGQSVEFADLF